MLAVIERVKTGKQQNTNNVYKVLKTTLSNSLMGALKPQSSGPLYSSAVIGTLAVVGWTVLFGTARRGLAGCGHAQSSPRCTKCNSPSINSQCTNFILFDVAL